MNSNYSKSFEVYPTFLTYSWRIHSSLDSGDVSRLQTGTADTAVFNVKQISVFIWTVSRTFKSRGSNFFAVGKVVSYKLRGACSLSFVTSTITLEHILEMFGLTFCCLILGGRNYKRMETATIGGILAQIGDNMNDAPDRNRNQNRWWWYFERLVHFLRWLFMVWPRRL